jgi:hypothetical protein
MKTKPTSPEYKAFENLLGQVLAVSKSELNRRIEAEKVLPSVEMDGLKERRPWGTLMRARRFGARETRDPDQPNGGRNESILDSLHPRIRLGRLRSRAEVVNKQHSDIGDLCREIWQDARLCIPSNQIGPFFVRYDRGNFYLLPFGSGRRHRYSYLVQPVFDELGGFIYNVL